MSKKIIILTDRDRVKIISGKYEGQTGRVVESGQTGPVNTGKGKQPVAKENEIGYRLKLTNGKYAVVKHSEVEVISHDILRTDDLGL